MGHLFNLIIVRLLTLLIFEVGDIFIIKLLCFFVHYISVTLFDVFVASEKTQALDLYLWIVWRFSDRNNITKVNVHSNMTWCTSHMAISCWANQ